MNNTFLQPKLSHSKKCFSYLDFFVVSRQNIKKSINFIQIYKRIYKFQKLKVRPDSLC